MGALVCEDFDGPLPNELSTLQDLGGEASLQDCQVYSGVGAARYVTRGEGFTQTRLRLPEPVSSGALHARFYTQITAASELADYQILFEYWHTEAGGDAEPITLYVASSGELQVNNGPSGGVLVAADPPILGRDQWHCVELAVELSDTAGSISVSLDGALSLEETGIDTLAMDPFLMAVIGSKRAPDLPDGSVELFLDELVVASEPIGCD